MDDLWRPLGPRLEARMREQELGVADLAARTGLAATTVRRLLDGHPVRARSLQLVVDALGLDWAQLVTRWAHTAPAARGATSRRATASR